MTVDRPTGPGTRLWQLWTRLSPRPGGRWLFSRLLGRMVPYTGSIAPRVLELRPGFARIAMRDRRRLRNHLHSLHAIAIVNLGEVTSGLAMTVALPASVRGIVVSLGATYHKKARGTLVATCECTVPTVGGAPVEHEIEARIQDASGELVATVRARWRLEQRVTRDE